jgi:hypothetical protein
MIGVCKNKSIQEEAICGAKLEKEKIEDRDAEESSYLSGLVEPPVPTTAGASHVYFILMPATVHA